MQMEFIKKTGDYNVGDVRTFHPKIAALYLKQKRAKEYRSPKNKAVKKEDVKTKAMA